ncbi:hypothetical protein [Sorangium sp. So ce233]|uniref:hypothetical protein n=1 Tax=Sorangium sp. So ce233 TaxID=3133290 RepID=UPI003F61ACB8
MSLPRYFQHALDEARRLLAESAGLRGIKVCSTRYMVVADTGVVRKARMYAPSLKDAVDITLSHWGVDRSKLVCAGRAGPIGLARVLDRAMVDTDGRPTLAPGEGAEVRRLLEMVAWDRVPQARWQEVFEQYREVLAGEFGPEGFYAALRARLEQVGVLAAERSAA